MAETELDKMDLKVGDSGSLAPVSSSSEESGQQWQQVKDQALEILSDLPDYVGGFFNQYQKPIISVGLLLGVLIAIRITMAVVEAINGIPLVAPTFELIGLGYSIWFIIRYLLKASDRQELVRDANSLKEQLFGQK